MDERSALGEDTVHKLRLNSPVSGWFPALQDLYWSITKSNLPYADLFFSPNLTKVSIYLSGSWGDSDIPHDILPTIASVIPAIPASALQLLVIHVDPRRVPWAVFKEPFSSVVLHCGTSLTELTSQAPLSDAAISHLIQLPHLHTWFTGGPPPNFPPPLLPPVFPPLVHLALWDNAICGWLSLFQRLECDVPPTQGTTSLSRMKGSLRFLNIRNLYDFVIDTSFTSPIRMFHNLISLNVATRCRDGDVDNRCAFELNNDNVTHLTTALPQLEALFLGHPCFMNTCATTVACLLSISTNCVKLRHLEIHFNTTNIVDDLENIFEDPRLQELRSLPRCTISCLKVYQIPLTLDESGLETVAHGMIDVFPSLKCFEGFIESWDELSERLAKFQGV